MIVSGPGNTCAQRLPKGRGGQRMLTRTHTSLWHGLTTLPPHQFIDHNATLTAALHGAQFTRLRYATSTLPANQQPQGPGQGQALSAPPAGPPNSNHQVSQHPTPTTLPEGPEPGGVFLYALMNNRSGCFITVWGQQTDTGLLALRRWRKVGDVPGACLDVSRDGRHLAVGTSEGAAMVGAGWCSPQPAALKSLYSSVRTVWTVMLM